ARLPVSLPVAPLKASGELLRGLVLVAAPLPESASSLVLPQGLAALVTLPERVSSPALFLVQVAPVIFPESDVAPFQVILPESDVAPFQVILRESDAALCLVRPLEWVLFPVRLPESVLFPVLLPESVLFPVRLLESVSLLAQPQALDHNWVCAELLPELAAQVSSAAQPPAQPQVLDDIYLERLPELVVWVSSLALLPEQVWISCLGQSSWISHAVSSWTAKNATAQPCRVRQLTSTLKES